MSIEQRPIVLASRSSQLAIEQTNIVLKKLRREFPGQEFLTKFTSTQGDKNQSQALYLLGGKSLWTKELEELLLKDEVHLLVHSLKDVPTTLPDGCVLGAILKREHGEDSLVVKMGYTVDGKAVHTLDDLPPGAVVGTSSVRRVAQLKKHRPDLVFKDVRGNLNTRLAKLDHPDGQYAALILAKAGLIRLGLKDRATSDVVPPTLFHAVGQGALAVEIREGDVRAQELCDKITHWQTRWCCLAERAFLRVLEGGCSVPVGIDSELKLVSAKDDEPQWSMRLVGTITALDGQRHIQEEVRQDVSSAERGEELGAQLAKLLVESGGKEILDEITKDRERRAGESEKSAQ